MANRTHDDLVEFFHKVFGPGDGNKVLLLLRTNVGDLYAKREKGWFFLLEGEESAKACKLTLQDEQGENGLTINITPEGFSFTNLVREGAALDMSTDGAQVARPLAMMSGLMQEHFPPQLL